MEAFFAMFGVMVIVAIAEGLIISRMQREQIKRMRRLKRKMQRAQKEQEELLQLLAEVKHTPPQVIRSGSFPVEMTEVRRGEE
jgi:uncharacterized membrane-anchored protein YhcB (DUF1043 family)